MADVALLLPPALPVLGQPARLGRQDGAPGIVVRERHPVGLAYVTARRGPRTPLAEAARTSFEIELPSVGRRSVGSSLALIGIGPDQWLAESFAAASPPIEQRLARSLGPHASIVDQTHARVILRLSGPRVRDVLATGVPLDLHPRAFKLGDAAQTVAAHIAVALWQLDEAPTYELSVGRSLISSSWHWLAAAAARHGLQVEPPL